MSRAVGLTEQLLNNYTQKIQSLEIIPSSGGVFEVTLDGRRIFSKKETGRFPEYDEIASYLDEKAGALRR